MDTDAYSLDGFLDGRIKAWQPLKGFRSSTDAVLLAAAVQAKSGDSVLELGCGAGVASLCLASRVPGLSLTGVEIQAQYAELATRNAALNNTRIEVVNSCVTQLPQSVRDREFDHIMANPPFFETNPLTLSPDRGRARARADNRESLVQWLDVAQRRARQKGSVTIVMTAERLPEILASLTQKCGDIRIIPIASRHGRAARRVIVSARKGGRGPLVLAAPIVMHEGEVHKADGDDFSPVAKDILRNGEAIR